MYDTPRIAKRFVPEKSVTVAFVDKEFPVAYGVVKNISETGACIITDSILSERRPFKVRMSFFLDEMLEAEARLVWSNVVDHDLHETHYGVQFTDASGSMKERLTEILGSPAFGSPPN